MTGGGAYGKTRVRTLVDGDGQRYALRETDSPKRSYGMRFSVLFDDRLEECGEHIKTASALRVFCLLPKRLSWTEFRPLRQEDLATRLGIDNASVSRGLAELLKLGVIERQGAGPYMKWRLSMDWGWKGSVASFQKTKRERQVAKTRLKVVVSNPLPPSAA